MAAPQLPNLAGSDSLLPRVSQGSLADISKFVFDETMAEGVLGASTPKRGASVVAEAAQQAAEDVDKMLLEGYLMNVLGGE